RSAGAGPVRYSLFGYREYGNDPIGVPDIEDHGLGQNAGNLAWLQIDDKQSLFARDLRRILALGLEPDNHLPPVIAEVNREHNELSRAPHVLDAQDGAGTDIDLVEIIGRDFWLYGSRLHPLLMFSALVKAAPNDATETKIKASQPTADNSSLS